MAGDPLDDVRAAVAAADLGPARRVRRAGAGQRNDVWLVDTATGTVVARLLHDDARLAVETALLVAAADAGVPVATCLWSAGAPRPVMIQSLLSGRRLSDSEPTPSLCRDLARTLRTIHSIPIVSGFGNLRPDLRGATEDLAVWFTDHVRAEAASTALGSSDRGLLDAALVALHDACPLLSRQQPGLVHGDIQPFNLLVHEGRISGVVDWEAAKSGPPAFDFGWWDWWSVAYGTPWPTEELIAAYDEAGALDRDEIDRLRTLVRLRVWTRELLAASRARDLARAAAARSGLAAELRSS